MRYTVTLDDDVNREVRAFAREHGMTLSGAVNYLARLGFAEQEEPDTEAEPEPSAAGDRDQES